jgi:hypothetical protein
MSWRSGSFLRRAGTWAFRAAAGAWVLHAAGSPTAVVASCDFCYARLDIEGLGSNGTLVAAVRVCGY